MAVIDVRVGVSEHVMEAVEKGGGLKSPGGGGIEDVSHEDLIYDDDQKGIDEK